MRHRTRANNISRNPDHRDAMIRNLVVSLFDHERIRTTPRKAKAARELAESLITLGKKGTLHARRLALARLAQNKPMIRKLFAELGPRYQGRSGGYTRVIRLPQTIRLPQSEAAHTFKRAHGRRLGDGAPQVYLELVEAEVSPRKHKPSERRAGRIRRRREFAAAASPGEAKKDSAPVEAKSDAAEPKEGPAKAGE